MISRVTVTKKSTDTGESAQISRNNHRAGNVDVSAGPVVTTLVCFFHSHTRLRVQQNTRHSLRPLFSGVMPKQNSGAIAPRECGVIPHRHAPRRRGIQYSRRLEQARPSLECWIARSGRAMTADTLAV